MATPVNPRSGGERWRVQHRWNGYTNGVVNRFKLRYLGYYIASLSWASYFGPWADAHSLRVRVQPGRGYGGEPFLEQPQVEILEGEGGDMDIYFEVRANLLD